MKKSGLADSPFFAMTLMNKVATPLSTKPVVKKKKITNRSKTSPKTKPPHNHDTTASRNHETMQPWYHDTAIELVRKAVKEIGKEAATHRFTIEEKKTVREVVFTYENRGILTSENEITRIAVNCILNDYKENGENSLLGRVLKALNE
jgi:hypothetical protein